MTEDQFSSSLQLEANLNSSLRAWLIQTVELGHEIVVGIVKFSDDSETIFGYWSNPPELSVPDFYVGNMFQKVRLLWSNSWITNGLFYLTDLSGLLSWPFHEPPDTGQEVT